MDDHLILLSTCILAFVICEISTSQRKWSYPSPKSFSRNAQEWGTILKSIAVYNGTATSFWHGLAFINRRVPIEEWNAERHFEARRTVPVHRECFKKIARKHRVTLLGFLATSALPSPSAVLPGSAWYKLLNGEVRGLWSTTSGYFFKIGRSSRTKSTENLISLWRIIPLSQRSSLKYFPLISFERNKKLSRRI